MARERSSLPKRSEISCCLSYGLETVSTGPGPLEICDNCPYVDDFSFINRLAGHQVYKIIPKDRPDHNREIQPLLPET